MTIRQIAFLGGIFLALAMQSCRAGEASLLSLSMEHFRDTATVTDDPIAAVTTVATEKGYVEHHGPLGAVWNDEYLTGTIDRKTGQRSFEVIVEITYRGTRRAYRDARFESANGPVLVPAILLNTSAVNCPTGECTYTDRVSFAVEESVLRALTTASAAGAPRVCHFTLAARSGGSYSGVLSVAEIAGFLARFDEYTGAAPPVVSHAAYAKPELGIGGLHVDGTEELPARSGVLVTAVRRGSVADEAGIIVGDIVREMGGRAIHTPSDLEAAMAGAAPHTPIDIKVYRGTAELTLRPEL